METETLVALVMFASMTAFSIGFFVIVHKIVSAAYRRSPSATSARTTFTKEQFNQEVSLSPQEQATMRRGMWFASGMVALLFGLFIGVHIWEYYRFVLVGEKVQAEILDISTYRSGRNNDTKYRYTLEATVRGARVRDTYDMGSSSPYDEGDILAAYVTTGSDPELAVAEVEDRDPWWILGGTAGLVGLQILLQKQRRRIASGRMRIANLPKDMRRRKLEELHGTGSASAEENISQDGNSSREPTYSIGASVQPPSSPVPPQGDDGRNYRP